MRCNPSIRISPTMYEESCTACACRCIPNGWMASAIKQINRNSSRTRRRPHAISMGGARDAAPLRRLKHEVDHDSPLIKMSGYIVIECKAHQHDQQGYPHLLPEILGALGQRATLRGFHQLIHHLTAVEQRHRQQIEHSQAHADDGQKTDERRRSQISADARELGNADRTRELDLNNSS